MAQRFSNFWGVGENLIFHPGYDPQTFWWRLLMVDPTLFKVFLSILLSQESLSNQEFLDNTVKHQDSLDIQSYHNTTVAYMTWPQTYTNKKHRKHLSFHRRPCAWPRCFRWLIGPKQIGFMGFVNSSIEPCLGICEFIQAYIYPPY